MKWAAVAIVAAALLAGGCDTILPSGTVTENRPASPTECKGAADVKAQRTYLLTLRSSANDVDENDPHRSWKPVISTKCVTPQDAANHPVGSNYLS